MRSLGVLGMALSLLGCADTRSAGGSTGVETTNGVLAVSVRDSAGSPLAGVLVRLRPASWKPGAALPSDSTQLEGWTDSLGVARFTALGSGLWRGEARGSGWSAQFLDTARPADRTRVLALQRMGSLVGRCAPRAFVVTAGLSHWTWADDHGDFRMDSLPSGLLDVRTPQDGARVYATVAAGASRKTAPMAADPADGTLVDDFQDGDSRTRFGAAAGGGWWYVSAGSGMTVLPAGSIGSPALAVATDSVTGNRWFGVDIRRDTAVWPWWETGLDFGPGADFSTATAIVLRIRSTAAVNLRLRCRLGDSLAGWETSLPARPDWTEIRVPLSQLRGKGAPPTTSALARTAAIAFQTTLDGRLDVDDLRIEGVPPWRMWPGLVMP